MNPTLPQQRTPREVVASLHPLSGSLRCRTGVVLVPPSELKDIAQWGARWGVDTVFYGAQILQELPQETRFVSLSADTETERLRRLARVPTGSAVLLIADFDIALARLLSQEREHLWQNIIARLTQTERGLLFAMPETAHRLLPSDTLQDVLAQSGRLATWTDTDTFLSN